MHSNMHNSRSNGNHTPQQQQYIQHQHFQQQQQQQQQQQYQQQQYQQQQQQQYTYRGRAVVDGVNTGSPHSMHPHQNPPTPPLIFTPQFGGTPPHQQDPFSTSPYAEPLQVSYHEVLGRHNSRTLIEVEDSPIKVTCRTKGGARSPYLMSMLNDVAVEPDRGGRHNPYTFNYSGSSSPLQVSTPTYPQQHACGFDGSVAPAQVMQRAGRYYPVEQTVADAHLVQGHSVQLEPTFELPPEVVHRSLKDRCRYIQFPATTPVSFNANAIGSTANGVNNPSSNGSTGSAGSNEASLPIALFIGQVRFETTPAELLWLVHRTCGACASHLESRGAGCYLLYCRSEADLTLVRSLHKRILFDIGGVWLARTAEEVDAMCEYIALDAPLISKKARLPRDSMVVEELKADTVSGGSRRGHGGGNAGGSSDRRTTNHNGASGGLRGAAKDVPNSPCGESRHPPGQNHQQRRHQQRQNDVPPSYQDSTPSS